MSGAEIPPHVQRFIATHIDSVEKLEVLLLLRRRSDRSWNARDVALELRIAEASAGQRLEDLTARGLLAADGTTHYRFAPRSADAAQDVAALAATYAERRVSVISFIFSNPLDKIRGFAESFRLKKDPKDG